MREIRASIMPHPKYSDNSKKQKAMEDGVDAMCASILEMVATVTHKRLTQFAQILAEKIDQEAGNEQG